MKRAFLFLLFILATAAFSQRTATRPYTFTAGDTIRASYFESNYDTIYHVVNDNGDTMNTKFLRKADFRGFMTDSTWPASSFDSIKINGGEDYLTEYIDTTFSDTLYDNTTYKTHATARIVQIGNLVTLYQPSAYAAISTSAKIGGIPSIFYPSSGIEIGCVLIVNNGNYEVGRINIPTSGNCTIITAAGGGLSTGTCGIQACTISWIIN